MTALSKLVRERDQRFNSPRQLEATKRPTQNKLICISCRRTPDLEKYQARWLAEHPMPRRYCIQQCYARTTFTESADHKRWHLDLYVSSNMPRFEAYALVFKCPDCGGRLVEIAW